MKDLFKFFGLSFFSDKIAREARNRGFAVVIVSLVLAFMFFLFGYIAADVVPFSAHFDRASDYKAFIQTAFGGAALDINDGKARSDKLINTYTSEADRAAYSRYGYDLIVDTRPLTTLIEFTQTAKKGDKTIDYAQFKALPKSEQKQYEITHNYTDKELVLDEELEARTEKYLESISVVDAEIYDEAGANEYAELKNRRGDYETEDYRRELWYLYVKYYYTSAKSILATAKAPTLRDYYYLDYVSGGKTQYLYVFDNMAAGSFTTDESISYVFGGYFDGVDGGAVTDGAALIKQIYYDTAGDMFFSYVMSTVSQLPFLVLVPIAVALVMWGIGKLVKDGWDKTFGGCYKTVNSFVWFGAFIVGLTTFVCSFFVPSRTMYDLMPILFAVILTGRTAVFCITSAVKSKKSLVPSDGEKIFGDII